MRKSPHLRNIAQMTLSLEQVFNKIRQALQSGHWVFSIKIDDGEIRAEITERVKVEK